MPSIAPAALMRWMHHRNSSDYRELQESILLGCAGVRGKSRKSWRTVPGLLVKNDDCSIEFDENIPQHDMVRMGGRMDGHTLCRNWAARRNRLPPTRNAGSKTSSEGEAKIMDSESFETTETEDESEQEEQYKMGKVVRWADHAGKELAVTLSIDSLAYINTRIVVLLLDLKERLFEFVQCEFNTDERLTVSDVLRQLPAFASISCLAQQRYRTLCRPDEELINMLPIQNYQIREGEIIVAAGSGIKPKEAMAAASSLLSQKRLVKAVHKAKLCGRALQRLMSSRELTEVPEKGRPDIDSPAVVPDEAGDEVAAEDAALIAKVLSKELGEDFVESPDFADFSFPVFEPEDDYFMSGGYTRDSTQKTSDDWFDDLMSFSCAEEEDDFSSDVTVLSDMHEHLDETSVASQGSSERTQYIDAFGSSSHLWSEKDVVVPDFSVVSL